MVAEAGVAIPVAMVALVIMLPAALYKGVVAQAAQETATPPTTVLEPVEPEVVTVAVVA